jgi:hypothetical protein
MVGTDGLPLISENEYRVRDIAAREMHARAMNTIAQVLVQSIPKFHAVLVAQANAIGAVAMGMANMGLIELEEDEETSAAGSDTQQEGEQSDGSADGSE